jgi:hypothetical protein
VSGDKKRGRTDPEKARRTWSMCMGHLRRRFADWISGSTAPWLAGSAVVQGRGLWVQDEVVAPDAAADNSTSGCDFEFKPEEVTTLPMRTALFVGHCLPCWKGISKLKLDQQLDIEPSVGSNPLTISSGLKWARLGQVQFQVWRLCHQCCTAVCLSLVSLKYSALQLQLQQLSLNSHKHTLSFGRTKAGFVMLRTQMIT